MDWMYSKYLRNIEVQNMSKWSRLACIGYVPTKYPVRSLGNQSFQPIGGFTQHPNSSSDM